MTAAEKLRDALGAADVCKPSGAAAAEILVAQPTEQVASDEAKIGSRGGASNPERRRGLRIGETRRQPRPGPRRGDCGGDRNLVEVAAAGVERRDDRVVDALRVR